MTTPIVTRPSPSLLERFRVGQPVSASHMRRWAQSLGCERAYNVQQYGVHQYLPRTVLPAGTVNYPVLYHRRSGVETARAVIAAHPDTDGALFRCSIAGVGFGGFGNDLTIPSTRHIAVTHHAVTLGVSSSGVSVLTAAFTATDQCKGLRTLAIGEIPRTVSDPVNDATDPGVNESSIEPRNRIHTPTSPDTADGLRRMIYELDRARTEYRGCRQIATSEDITFDTIQSTSVGYAPLDWRAHAGDPTWYFLPRQLYLDSTANACTFYIRYYWSGAGTAKVRANCTSLTTGTTATSVITLTTGGVWTVQSAALNVPVDGADGICAVTFDADSDATVIDLSNIAIFDTEA